MTTTVKLSRLAITGLVTASTPSIVLKEIADAHSILWEEDKIKEPDYLVQFIHNINTKKVSIIREPYDRQDYKLIARYVNRHQQWRKSTLDLAFKKLLEYTNLDKIKEIHQGFEPGLQTPDNINSLNACVLYAICRVNRIDTRFDTTMMEMASNIQMLFSLRNMDIYRTVRTTIYESLMYGNCNGYQLVNMLAQIDPDKANQIITNNNTNNTNNTNNNNNQILLDIIIDYEELRLTGNDIINRDDGDRLNRLNRLNILRPRNHTEAVAMAAIYYKMDISKVRNPLAEYQELTRIPYFPLDNIMARRIQTANMYPDTIENPHLNKVFNPELPSNLYDEEDLIQMCLDEGYSQDTIRDEGAYTILQTSYLLPTFLHGKQGNIGNRENTMLDEISEISYDNVIVYGVRGSTMRFYTYGELTDTFKALKRFQRPDGNEEIFTDLCISKLYVLSNHEQRDTESDSIYNERLELAQEIDSLTIYEEARQGPARGFIEKYDQSSFSLKHEIENTLVQLLKCAMYMRGWTGAGPYPLSSDEALVEYDEQVNVDMRVTESLAELDRMITNLNLIDIGNDNTGTIIGVGDMFKSLPLIFYHARSQELLPSTNHEEGLTIYQRINIVRGGESGSYQSCIRLSSNRFAASAYYYMRLLRMPIPFNIHDLSHIM